MSSIRRLKTRVKKSGRGLGDFSATEVESSKAVRIGRKM